MNVDGVGHAHFGNNDVTQVNPSLEGQNFEEGEHGVADVVEVESPRVHPDSGSQ